MEEGSGRGVLSKVHRSSREVGGTEEWFEGDRRSCEYMRLGSRNSEQ